VAEPSTGDDFDAQISAYYGEIHRRGMEAIDQLEVQFRDDLHRMVESWTRGLPEETRDEIDAERKIVHRGDDWPTDETLEMPALRPDAVVRDKDALENAVAPSKTRALVLDESRTYELEDGEWKPVAEE
jgi:hypothetical protein